MPRHLAALFASPEDVEQQFYEALQEGDLDKLMAVWAEDDEIVCVHPGGVRLVGLAAVRGAYEDMLGQGGLPLRPLEVRRLHGLGCAVHSVTECLEMRTPEGLRRGWALATNVYLKTPQGWRLAAHHATAASDEAPPPSGEVPTVLH
ncbi:YybH family protein [Ideonella livida]|uniref:Nuclear transport factor 2 family protein n=1 Tax=Ideonella livida TaxID=2707176 RepID=A0A7C9TLX7_9BURK|nr:nuclear transport factor 2 family protein [Ideonella livida]NDY93860.1 nuclear transport factor 2 family protein [Ideonella livida]